jgi:hypothetical protein
MQSKSQDQEVDYAEPDAGVDGEDHAATQLFVRLIYETRRLFR